MNTGADLPRETNWKQVYSLLALNAAIVISWIAYHNYQPKVLALFHFQQLTFFLVVAQAVILVCIPGTAGMIGDYMIKTNGNRFVVFTVGISVTAMVFMSVAFTLGSATTINLTAALPVMIVIWLISMNVFHSPANSMLEIFAPAKELPAAMALMVLTTELLYAFEPLVVNFVDWIGPVSTFALGGVLLIVTGYFFRRTTKNVKLSREYEETKAESSNYLAVFVTGLLLGLASAIIKNSVPGWLLSKTGTASITSNGSLFVSFILAIAALAAWPISKLLDQYGLEKGLRFGLVGAFVCLLMIYFMPNVYFAIFFCVATGLCFSSASVAAFPFALKNLSVRNVTLGAGLFFGSVELSDGIMNIVGGL